MTVIALFASVVVSLVALAVNTRIKNLDAKVDRLEGNVAILEVLAPSECWVYVERSVVSLPCSEHRQ